MSRRLVMRAITFLSAEQGKRLAAGRCVIGKIGEEHDGQQLVVRLTPQRRPGMFDGMIEVSVTQWEWDHGGCMIGEERQNNSAASPLGSPPSGRAASASPGPSITTETSPSPPQFPAAVVKSSAQSHSGDAGKRSAAPSVTAPSCSTRADDETPARSVHSGDAGKRSGGAGPGVDRSAEFPAARDGES
jgi:hypothetical protein